LVSSVPTEQSFKLAFFGISKRERQTVANSLAIVVEGKGPRGGWPMTDGREPMAKFGERGTKVGWRGVEIGGSSLKDGGSLKQAKAQKENRGVKLMAIEFVRSRETGGRWG